jgi:hypothetical protein
VTTVMVFAEVIVRPAESVVVNSETVVSVREVDEGATLRVANDDATAALMADACAPRLAAAEDPTKIATDPAESVSVIAPPLFKTAACDCRAAI